MSYSKSHHRVRTDVVATEPFYRPRLSFYVDVVGQVNIGGAGFVGVAVGGEDEFGAIMGEHGEAVKYSVKREPGEAGAVESDEIKLKIVAIRLPLFPPIVHIAGKNNALAIRVPGGRERIDFS